MITDDELRKEAAALPVELRELLEAELAAGNAVLDIGHHFPAPPIGAFFKLARPVTTRERRTTDTIRFRSGDGTGLWGEFTDPSRRYFLLEPQVAPPPPAPPPPPPAEPARSALARFTASMAIDYEKWHDGIGYDLEAIAAASPDERAAIEQLVLQHSPRGWRDVEALAALGTPAAHDALRRSLASGDAEVRGAVLRHAPELVSDRERTRALVKALESAEFYGGLTQALHEVAEHHPPEVVKALLKGARRREGTVAVHFAAMLFFLHGKAKEPFDWEHRPFFLRFGTEDRKEREAAYRDLCDAIGVPRR
jgi:hypothetical protein